MKAQLFSVYSKILSVLLLFFGVTSCDSVDEYGSPSATYKIKGSIVNIEDDTPIEGIKAKIGIPRYDNNELKDVLYIDSVYTQNNGKFNFVFRDVSYSSRYLLKLEDIDGEKNGLYEEKTESFDFENLTLTGGDGKWYMGEAEKDMGTIKITPVKE